MGRAVNVACSARVPSLQGEAALDDLGAVFLFGLLVTRRMPLLRALQQHPVLSGSNLILLICESPLVGGEMPLATF